MGKVSSFYMGIYDVVDDPSLDSIISWSKSNKSFIVWNPAEFHRRVLWNSAALVCFDFTTFFSDTITIRRDISRSAKKRGIRLKHDEDIDELKGIMGPRKRGMRLSLRVLKRSSRSEVFISMGKLSSFYMGIYDVVDDPSLDSIISWSKSNKSFIVWNPAEFHRRVLWDSAALACFDFTTFFSQLKRHGFKRIKGTENHLEFGHAKYFVRGQPDLMKNMQKKAFEKYSRENCAKVRREAKAAMELKGSLARLRL